MRTKETGRKAIGFEYPHGSDEWLKSRVLKLCKHGSVRGAVSHGRSTATLIPSALLIPNPSRHTPHR